MNQTMQLTEREKEMLMFVLSDKRKTDFEIEKTKSEFRVHYKSDGGSGSQAIIYSLAGSMKESAAKIRELEKNLH